MERICYSIFIVKGIGCFRLINKDWNSHCPRRHLFQIIINLDDHVGAVFGSGL